MGWLTVPSLLDPRYNDRYHQAAAGTITAIAAASVLVILGLLLARAFGRLLRDPLGLLTGDAKFLPPASPLIGSESAAILPPLISLLAANINPICCFPGKTSSAICRAALFT
jgi:hypothetical protein